MDRVVFISDKLSWDPADAPYHHDLTQALNRSLDDAVRCFLDWTWRQRDRMPVVHPWLRAACQEYGLVDLNQRSSDKNEASLSRGRRGRSG